MFTAVFHSVNAMLYFYAQGHGLLVDGAHGGYPEGFSNPPSQLQCQLRRRTGLFSHVDTLLFTHLHPDHFDASALDAILEASPAPRVYGPGLDRCSIPVRPVSAGITGLSDPPFQVLAINTVHDGASFSCVPHRSYLLSCGEECFFIGGDAVLGLPQADLLAQMDHPPVTAAFLNPYQLSSSGGQAFLRALSPQRVFLYHLPFPNDDRYGFYPLARQALRNDPADLPRADFLPQIEWLDTCAPDWPPR